MTKGLDYITINTVVKDAEDVARLGSFLLALSRSPLEERGARGAARVEPFREDYRVVFDNGAVLYRSSYRDALLFRETKCPVEECTHRTMSATARGEFCSRHWNEMHDVA